MIKLTIKFLDLSDSGKCCNSSSVSSIIFYFFGHNHVKYESLTQYKCVSCCGMLERVGGRLVVVWGSGRDPKNCNNLISDSLCTGGSIIGQVLNEKLVIVTNQGSRFCVWGLQRSSIETITRRTTIEMVDHILKRRQVPQPRCKLELGVQ